MLRVNHSGTVMGLAASTAFLLTIAVAPNALAQEEEFDMNDRFATEAGASGIGTTRVDEGSVELAVEAEGAVVSIRALHAGGLRDVPRAGAGMLRLCFEPGAAGVSGIDANRVHDGRARRHQHHVTQEGCRAHCVARITLLETVGVIQNMGPYR